MAYGTYTIRNVGGLVKKLSGDVYTMDMGNGAAIIHASHLIVYSGNTWNWSYTTNGRQILFFEPGAWVEFEADCETAGKIGTFLTMNGFEVEVKALGSGTAPRLIRASEIKFSDQSGDLIAKGAAALVGDALYAGDMLYIPNTNIGSKYRITNLCEGWRAHCPGGNEMPGLEEGMNEINLFGADEGRDPNQAQMFRSRIMRPSRMIRRSG